MGGSSGIIKYRAERRESWSVAAAPIHAGYQRSSGIWGAPPKLQGDIDRRELWDMQYNPLLKGNDGCLMCFWGYWTSLLCHCLVTDPLHGFFLQIKREDLQPQVLHHGPQLLCHIPCANPLKCATYISTLNAFLTIDSGGHILLQNRAGRVMNRTHFPWLPCGALYAWQAQHYVVWSHKEMLLLDQSLSLVSRCPVPQGVTCSVYDSGRNRVLCGGSGGVTVWIFSRSVRNLAQCRILDQGMTDQDMVALVALDTTSPLPQSCFAVCKTSVWEYDLNSGDLLRVQRNLHLRKITGLLYSELLQLLISGSRDGSIKIWNRDAQLKVVYLGHTGPVTALALDVPGMTVFSGSGDSTLRTWDLESHEQVGEQQMTGPVLRLEAFSEDGTHVVSQTSCFLDVWRVHKLYHLKTNMGTTVTDLKMSQWHLPSRTLCVCVDSTVRLMAAGTGHVISTLLLEPGSRPLAAEYHEPTESVFVLLERGEFIKANVLYNPMSIENQVTLGSAGGPPLCFTLFPIIEKETRAGTERRETAEYRGQKTSTGGKQPRDTGKQNTFLALVGKSDGTLSVFDWARNRELFHFEAHCPAKVTHVISSPKDSIILTAGSDMTIKVWRFFPHVEECFGLILTFPCSQPVGLMCVMKSQLFVVFNDPSTATHSLVQYDLQTQTRKDHSPGDDHLDQITGLCPCPEVGLLATSARDGTIRI
uniref:Uncharacterized protein n=1 Tax=Leptobrachium leishanense TaxID=445787 RepID=A0A8C5MPP8_9ANUR